MSRTFVIADVASAHDGRLQLALEAIDVAADAGADAIKFQYWSQPDQLADRRRVPSKYREVYREYRMPNGWLSRLAGRAAARNIEFMCTAFLPQDVAVIAPYVKRFKVAAFESEAQDLIRAIDEVRGDRDCILSVSADRLRSTIDSPYRRPSDVLMHCVSAYPANPTQMNLAVVTWIAQRFTAGLSDHSGVNLMGALARAAGASFIETHITLPSTNSSNPDAGAFAWRPKQFTRYVEAVRWVDLIRGDGVLTSQECESEMHKYRVHES